MKNVKFISYTGVYPVLCSGTLTIAIGDEIVELDRCLKSGGNVYFDQNWSENVTKGPWKVTVPNNLLKYKTQIEKLVNLNVPRGCCGGCV